jgi:hypothetical protein
VELARAIIEAYARLAHEHEHDGHEEPASVPQSQPLSSP